MKTIIFAACVLLIAGCAKKPEIHTSTTTSGDWVVVVSEKPKSQPKPFTTESFLFGFDSYKLSAGQYGRMNLTCYRANRDGIKLKITGYADSTRSGKYPEKASSIYNKILSGRRANAVYEGLKAAGCHIDSVTVYGDTKKFGEAKSNRRVLVEKAD